MARWTAPTSHLVASGIAGTARPRDCSRSVCGCVVHIACRNVVICRRRFRSGRRLRPEMIFSGDQHRLAREVLRGRPRGGAAQPPSGAAAAVLPDYHFPCSWTLLIR